MRSHSTMPDLITIPGLAELWTHTQGDSCFKIAALDCPASTFADAVATGMELGSIEDA